MLRFDRFELDAANMRLEDASGPIRLNPKAFEVLRVLIERRGQLVLKDELLDEVWPGTHVADGVLAVCVTEIRSALADSAREPRFIETVHRRGYRFIAGVTVAGTGKHNGRSDDPVAQSSLPAWVAHDTPARESPLVGRARELE